MYSPDIDIHLPPAFPLAIKGVLKDLGITEDDQRSIRYNHLYVGENSSGIDLRIQSPPFTLALLAPLTEVRNALEKIGRKTPALRGQWFDPVSENRAANASCIKISKNQSITSREALLSGKVENIQALVRQISSLF